MAIFNKQTDTSVVFVTHLEGIGVASLLAKEMSRRFDIGTTLWTTGGRDYRAGIKSGGFDEVVNLLQGFDRFGAISDAQYAEHLSRIRQLEQDFGAIFYNQDAAMDRSMTGSTSPEVDYFGLKSRWTRQQIAAMTVHLVQGVQKELARLGHVLAVGETNTLPYRLIYRVLYSRHIPYLYPIGLPGGLAHLDERMYFDETLYLSWDQCSDWYSKFIEAGIPGELVEWAQRAYSNITDRHVKPGYYVRAGRGAPGWRQRLAPGRIAHGLRSWREVSRQDELSSPRAVLPEVASPRAKIQRVIETGRRGRFYESVTERTIPKQPYACYLLHVQPEHTVEGLAFEYQDQVALLRNIVAALPADIILVVKEHKPMAGCRPIAFYGELTSIPNVYLIHDTVDSLSLIRDARVTLTLTGTVALESMCFGIPSVVLGNAYYERFDGVYRAHSIDELRRLLSELEGLRGASQNEAMCALAARYTASFHIGRSVNGLERSVIGKAVDGLAQEFRHRGIPLHANSQEAAI